MSQHDVAVAIFVPQSVVSDARRFTIIIPGSKHDPVQYIANFRGLEAGGMFVIHIYL